ncbi:MAG: response regulator transcription factor [Haloplanus sp.]
MTNSTTEPKVLVVDDEQPLADLYAHWLGDIADVTTAYDGTEALDAVTEAFDVVLLDRRMPGYSGDEVVEKLCEEGLDVRVVMVTAVDPGFDIVEMRIDDYLVKPVDEHDLVETVERMVVRDTYDDQLQEKFRLVEKKVTLEAAKTPTELESSEEYAELTHQLSELEENLDTAVDEFTDTDFTVAFRDLPAGNHTD